MPVQHEYDCFVSYTTREDEVQLIKPFVDRYIGDAKSRVLTYCPIYYDDFYIDRTRQRDQSELGKLLQDGIRQSRVSVCFLSPGYLTSQWCAYEWLESRSSILSVLWKPSWTLRFADLVEGLKNGAREPSYQGDCPIVFDPSPREFNHHERVVSDSDRREFLYRVPIECL